MLYSKRKVVVLRVEHCKDLKKKRSWILLVAENLNFYAIEV